MANYILWGKDRETGLNAKQDGSVELASRHGDWDEDNRVESLDALMESPTFNEASLLDVNIPATKIKREVFSRDEALARCPEEMQESFRALFHAIDELDLKINYYDLLHGKRVKQPRDGLLRKFSEEEQLKMQETVTHWNQFQYLKRRHELIELRRQQYTLRDSYEPIMCKTPSMPNYYQEDVPFNFGEDVNFLPLGLVDTGIASKWIFRPIEELHPTNFSENQLKEIYKLYWEKEKSEKNDRNLYFDFGSEEHLYEVFQLWDEMSKFYELGGQCMDDNDEDGIQKFLKTLKYYIDFADLTDLQREILDYKLKKKKNDDIVYEINKKWKKSYTANYISTIFTQRIIPKIAEAVTYHQKIISNLCYEEEFKTCSCCGRVLLRDSINFTKKTRSKDGFTSRCKKCEKSARDNKKEI